MIAFLLSKTGLAMLGAALVAGVIFVQTARLAHAKSDLAHARASLATAEASLKASEDRRDTEYRKAVSALSDAQDACNKRVAEALKAGAVIKRIVTRVPVVDQKGCAVRQMVSADELRSAVAP